MHIRKPSPNELRCIVRDNLGFYRSVLVGGVYHFHGSDQVVDLNTVDTYVPAVRHCIDKHAALSATVQGDVNGNKPAPVFVQAEELDLRNHIKILRREEIFGNDALSAVDEEIFRRTLELIHDEPIPSDATIPRWKVVVLQMPPQLEQDSPTKRCFIAFAYSHAISDGTSGLAFHRTFLEGLKQPVTVSTGGSMEYIYRSPDRPLPLPIDWPGRLPISWSYLLTPALLEYLPRVASVLGLKSDMSLDVSTTWTGNVPSYDPQSFRTGIDTITLKPSTVRATLNACRSHEAKLTALLHEFIVQALSNSLPPSMISQKKFFMSMTATNLRALVGVSNNEMGLYASGVNQVYPAVTTHLGTNAAARNSQDNIGATPDLTIPSSDFWSSARAMTTKLADSTTTLDDQALGLLGYISNFRSWMEEKIGKPRDSTYEISNLLVFDPEESHQQPLVPASAAVSSDTAPQTKVSSPASSPTIEKLIFSQPANALSAPLAFNVISVKGGDLVCTVSWEIGSIGESPTKAEREREERALVRRICEGITRSFEAL